MTGTRLVAVGHYQPARVVPNSELEQMVDTTDEWIQRRVGIKRRHWASAEETVDVMAERAARDTLTKAGLSADQDPDHVGGAVRGRGGGPEAGPVGASRGPGGGAVGPIRGPVGIGGFGFAGTGGIESPPAPDGASGTGGAGSAAVYPAASTWATSSAGSRPSGTWTRAFSVA